MNEHRLTRWTASLVLLVILGACSGAKTKPEDKMSKNVQAMRDAVSRTIAEPQRRQELLGMVDEFERSLAAIDSEVQRFGASMRQLNADFNAPRSAFEQAITEFQVKRRQAQQDLIDRYVNMMARVSEEEWKTMVRYEGRAIEEAVQGARQ